MRISDWSSDVCSSDLLATMWTLWWVALLPAAVLLAFGSRARGPSRALGAASVALAVVIVLLALLDRQSVVSGKSVSVREALGGRRIIKTKNNTNTVDTNNN